MRPGRVEALPGSAQWVKCKGGLWSAAHIVVTQVCHCSDLMTTIFEDLCHYLYRNVPQMSFYSLELRDENTEIMPCV